MYPELKGHLWPDVHNSLAYRTSSPPVREYSFIPHTW